MKYLITLALLLSICLSSYAAIWYLRVPKAEADAIVARLDVLKGPSPYTTHYTLPIDPVVPESTTDVLIPIDERAQLVLTEAEWNSRLTDMPPEFVHPSPGTSTGD